MSNPKLLEPKNVEIVTANGDTKTFIFSKFPAIAGREIIAKYPLSSLPKVGDYSTSEETMIKLMHYVAIPVEGGEPLRLSNVDLINNHTCDWETLAKIELGMVEYNCTFFTKAGAIQGFIDLCLERVAPMLSKILTTSVEALSRVDSQLTSNSETSSPSKRPSSSGN